MTDTSMTWDAIFMTPGVDSVIRVLAVVEDFRNHYGHWPSRLLIPADDLRTIEHSVLTEKGMAMLNGKLDLVPSQDLRTMYAEGSGGETVEYTGARPRPEPDGSALTWIWGLPEGW